MSISEGVFDELRRAGLFATLLLVTVVFGCGPQVATPGNGGSGGDEGQGGDAVEFTCDGVKLRQSSYRDDELVYACLADAPDEEGCLPAGEEVRLLLVEVLMETGEHDLWCSYVWTPISVPCGPDPTVEEQCCYYAHMRYGITCY